MLKTIDSLLLNIWELFILLPRAIIYIFRIFILFLISIVNLMKRFKWFARFANTSFIKFVFHPPFTRFIKEKVSKFLFYFSSKMKKSATLRRYVFSVVVLVILFCSYPPSHWGPWYLYQTGESSYYSTGFWFKKTASGERFIPFLYTAAHKTLPLGITVKVKNLDNGKVVYVKINDRGPFVKGRILDLSSGAARKLGFIDAGITRVKIYTKKKMKK